jgi:hypothetical protein
MYLRSINLRLIYLRLMNLRRTTKLYYIRFNNKKNVEGLNSAIVGWFFLQFLLFSNHFWSPSFGERGARRREKLDYKGESADDASFGAFSRLVSFLKKETQKSTSFSSEEKKKLGNTFRQLCNCKNGEYVRCEQGDQMSLRKKITRNVAQPIFCKIYSRRLPRRKVDQFFRATSVIFKLTTQS